MMMDCPRCGFAQPKDRYCAKCGLDLEHYVSKPKPLLLRIVQNSTLHLSLIGLVILLLAGYIFSTQRELLSRRVEAIFSGLPLSSRDAADPSAAPKPDESVATDSVAASAEMPAADLPSDEPPLADEPALAAAADFTKLEVAAFEIPHEALTNLLGTAEKVAESGEGHAYYWLHGTKISEAVSAAGHPLGAARALVIQNGAQLAIETPPTAAEAFQFGLYFQVTKGESKTVALKWNSTLVLPPPDTPADANTNVPQVKALNETNLSGEGSLVAQGTLMIIIDPANRAPREDYLTKAGEGPWSVFKSDEFKAGATDWVMLVQLK